MAHASVAADGQPDRVGFVTVAAITTTASPS
jgi:hypothetical protein